MSNEAYTNELRHKVQKSTRAYRILLVAASIAQTIAIYFGLSDLLGNHGWAGTVIPVVAAPVVGIILYVIWDMLISTVPLLHNPVSRVMGGMLGLVMAAITVAASSWFIAAAIGGDGATVKHQQGYVAQATKQFDAALANTNREEALGARAGDIGTAWRGKAEREGKFGLLCGKGKGFGDCAMNLEQAAKNFESLAAAVRDKRAEAKAIHKQATDLIGEMGKNVPQAQFIEMGAKLKQLLVKLDGTSALSVASNIGVITFQTGIGDLRAEADSHTKEVRELAKTIGEERIKVSLDSYQPITAGAAVIKYAGDSASAWVVGIAIDLVPFILLLAMMLFHAEARDPYRRRRIFGEHDDDIPNTGASPVRSIRPTAAE